MLPPTAVARIPLARLHARLSTLSWIARFRPLDGRVVQAYDLSLRLLRMVQLYIIRHPKSGFQETQKLEAMNNPVARPYRWLKPQ